MLSTGFGSEFTSRCSDVCTRWLQDAYLPTANPPLAIAGRRHLRSAYRGRLNFPRVKLASYGGRSFAYAGPSNWNSLPAYLRDSSLSLTSFRRHLGAFLFSFCWASTRSAFGVLLQKARYINSMLLFIAAIMSQPCTSNRISS